MDESVIKSLEQDAEVRRVLLAAAELLERDGWCQGKAMIGQRRCLGKAIIDASDGLGFGKACRLLSVAWPNIPEWNDTSGRTLPEVLAALRGGCGIMSALIRFRKKPVVIYAVQYQSPLQRWPASWPQEKWHFSGDQLVIPTLEGSMCADIGDWIIQGVKGEFYPCKPDIFALTYERDGSVQP